MFCIEQIRMARTGEKGEGGGERGWGILRKQGGDDTGEVERRVFLVLRGHHSLLGHRSARVPTMRERNSPAISRQT